MGPTTENGEPAWGDDNEHDPTLREVRRLEQEGRRQLDIAIEENPTFWGGMIRGIIPGTGSIGGDAAKEAQRKAEAARKAAEELFKKWLRKRKEERERDANAGSGSTNEGNGSGHSTGTSSDGPNTGV